VIKTAVIREEHGEFCVRSPDNPDWNGGCYKSKEKAEERLKQVEFFKRNKAAYSYDRTAVGLRDMAQRIVQAEEDFIEVLMKQGGISKPEAEKVYEYYRKNKLIKRDAILGRISVKHGQFLDRDVILRALSLS
jgi:hypothetical protein